MFKSTMSKLTAAAALAVAASSVNAADIKNVGTPIAEEALVNWDISVFFDGENLPEGSGTLAEGEELWLAKCAMCHGEFGEGARGYPKMLGAPMEEFHKTAIEGGDNVGIRGLNNLWGHAPTLYDYIRRAMPFFAPQSLSIDESYSLTGYALYLAEIIDYVDEPIDAEFIKGVTMPAADNYYTDTRPDVHNKRCMKNCYDYEPEVKGMAVIGDVAVGAVKKVGEEE